MDGPLYIFLDESGNLDFSAKGTKYFILTALTVRRPFPWEGELNDLRYNLWERPPQHVELTPGVVTLEAFREECFHATEDLQPFRDLVFEIITRYSGQFRIDSVIVEKRKTHPPLREAARFYPKVLGYVLKYVFRHVDPAEVSEVQVITDSLPVKKHRGIVEGAIKSELKAMLTKGHRYSVSHRDSKSCFSLQVADYLCWALYRKWEKDDLRSYELIKKAVKSEFDIFRIGKSHYY